jgi:protein ImuA
MARQRFAARNQRDTGLTREIDPAPGRKAVSAEVSAYLCVKDQFRNGKSAGGQSGYRWPQEEDRQSVCDNGQGDDDPSVVHNPREAVDSAIRKERIAGLGRLIERIERRRPWLEEPDGPVRKEARGKDCGLVTGVAAIDAAIGAATPAALHEVRAPTALDLPAAAGFALALGGLLTRFEGMIFWIAGREARAETGEFHGPGLAELGFDPALLVRVFPHNLAESLWAAGEIAASPGVGLCLLELRGNPTRADLTFSRRLAHRAQASGTPVVLLRQSGGEEASAAATRWRVMSAPSAAGAATSDDPTANWPGWPAWRVELEKCRGARPGVLILEWRKDERLLAVCRNAARDRNAAEPGGAAGPPLSGGKPAAACDRPDRPAALGRGMAFGRAS